MSNYTPTTEDVREDFAFPWEGFKHDREGRLAAFDRWLALDRADAWDEGYEAAMADDRQRNLAQFTPNPYRKAEQ